MLLSNWQCRLSPTPPRGSPSTGTRYINYCPRGWSYYKLNCFKYFRQLRSWDEAEVSPMDYAQGRGPPASWGCPGTDGCPRRASARPATLVPTWLG